MITAEELLKCFEEDLESGVKVTAPTGTVVSPAVETTRTSPGTLDDDLGNLNKIIETKNQIAQVKDHLNIIIDSIADNPSMVSRLSNTFGSMPMWQKVSTGAALTLPALLTGVAASITSLLIIGGVTGVGYTATAIVLEDHYQCSENIKTRLRDGISSIADILEITIVALDNVRVRLSEQIARFKEANAELSKKVGTLQDQIHTLSIQVGILRDTGNFLLNAKEKLEKQIGDLEKDTAAQKDLIVQARKDLAATIHDYAENQKQLEKEVATLGQVRDDMIAEVAKTKKVSVALQAVVSDLSKQVVEDKAQKEKFQTKLKQLVVDEETTARTVVDRLSTTQRELDDAKKALCANNELNRELLDRQVEQIKLLQQLKLDAVHAVVRSESPQRMKAPGFLGVFGTDRVGEEASSASVAGVLKA